MEEEEQWKKQTKLPAEEKRIVNTKKIFTAINSNKTIQNKQNSESDEEINEKSFTNSLTSKNFNNAKTTTSTPNKLIEPLFSDKELKLCDENNWLSGDVIYNAIKLYINKEKGASEKFCIFESFHIQFLAHNNFESAIRTLYNIEALNKDSVLVVINTDSKGSGYHWILCQIQLNLKEIRIFNPSIQYKLTPLNKKGIKNLVIALYATVNEVTNLSDFTLIHVNSPQQGMKYYGDCGVFAINFAKSLILEEEDLSTPDEIHKTRSVLKKKLSKIPKKTTNSPTKDSLTDDELCCMDSIANNAGFYNDKYEFKEQSAYVEYVDLNTSGRSQNWSLCSTKSICLRNSGDDQVLCVICRGWIHKNCIKDTELKNKDCKFFICENCKM